MLGNIVMIENQEGKESKLNNGNTHINRGFELMIRPRKRKEEEEPKTFQLEFGKIISFFKTEINFYFNFQLGIKGRKKSQGEKQC